MLIHDLVRSHPHLQEFVPYIDLLNKESDRGKVLISSGFLEEQLSQVLQAFFLEVPQAKKLIEDGNAPLGTFSARISVCYVLGLISEDEHHDLHLIRRIRNEFAHKIHTTFETQKIVSWCELLKHRIFSKKEPKDPPIPADANFSSAAVSIILHLVNRPNYVSKERCAYKDWKY